MVNAPSEVRVEEFLTYIFPHSLRDPITELSNFLWGHGLPDSPTFGAEVPLKLCRYCTKPLNCIPDAPIETLRCHPSFHGGDLSGIVEIEGLGVRLLPAPVGAMDEPDTLSLRDDPRDTLVIDPRDGPIETEPCTDPADAFLPPVENRSLHLRVEVQGRGSGLGLVDRSTPIVWDTYEVVALQDDRRHLRNCLGPLPAIDPRLVLRLIVI